MKFEVDRRRDFGMLTDLLLHEEIVHEDSILLQRDQLQSTLGRFPRNHVLGRIAGAVIGHLFHVRGIDRLDLSIGLRDQVVRNFDGSRDFFDQTLRCLVDSLVANNISLPVTSLSVIRG